MKSNVLIQKLITSQHPLYDTRNQLKEMVVERTIKHKKTSHFLSNIKDVLSYQNDLRTQLIESIGGLIKETSPLNIEFGETLITPYYRRQCIIYESRPQVYVSAHLYFPLTHGKKPGILLACGHDKDGKDSKEYQFVAQTLVQYDCVVCVIDNVGQGERFSYLGTQGEKQVEGLTYEHDMAGYQASLIGQSIARYMIHDYIRAFDVLERLDEVDIHSLGITGNSGGGTISSILMLVEPRIKVAVVGTYITSRYDYIKTGQAQDREQHFYGLGKIGFDHDDFLICFAPKPVLILAAEYDFFPIEGTIRSVNSAGEVYKLFESEHLLEIYQEPVNHSYTPNMAQKAAQFFNKHFSQPVIYKNPTLEYDTHSKCSVHHQIRLDKRNALRIHDEINLHYQNKIEFKHNAIIDYLNDIVSSNRIETDLKPTVTLMHTFKDYDLKQMSFNSQKDMHHVILIFVPHSIIHQRVLVTWPSGCDRIIEHLDWVENLVKQGNEVWVVDLSNEGHIKQDAFVSWANANEPYGAQYKLNDDLYWLEDSIAALRSYELFKAIQLCKSIDQLSLKIMAYESHCIYLKINELIQPSLNCEYIQPPFETYKDWLSLPVYPLEWGYTIHIPNLLEYPDLITFKSKENL